MQLEIIILNEVTQKDKDNYHMILLICEIQNMAQINLSPKQKQTQRHREKTAVAMGDGLRKEWSGRPGLADVSYYI